MFDDIFGPSSFKTKAYTGPKPTYNFKLPTFSFDAFEDQFTFNYKGESEEPE